MMYIAYKSLLARLYRLIYNKFAMNNSYLYIHNSILKSNILSIFKNLPEGSSLIPVLKDNAYGLGVENVLPSIDKFCSMYAVAHISEGVRLRELTDKDILVLGNPVMDALDYAYDAALTISVSRLGLIPLLKKGTKVHIAFNCGLNRTGIEIGEIPELTEEIRFSDIMLTGAYSHKGSFDAFIRCCDTLEDYGINIPFKHYCCSEVYEEHPEYSLDGVRLGRRIFQSAPGMQDDIKECFTWKAFITDLNFMPEGTSLGYNSEYILKRNSKLAVISVGTGDGLNRDLIKAHSPVMINGKRANILVSFMDQTIVDVTGIECCIGDEVILFGYDKAGNLLPSQVVASGAGLEGVDLTSVLTQRVKKELI